MSEKIAVSYISGFVLGSSLNYVSMLVNICIGISIGVPIGFSLGVLYTSYKTEILYKTNHLKIELIE